MLDIDELCGYIPTDAWNNKMARHTERKTLSGIICGNSNGEIRDEFMSHRAK